MFVAANALLNVTQFLLLYHTQTLGKYLSNRLLSAALIMMTMMVMMMQAT